jgi:hypothetical protein
MASAKFANSTVNHSQRESHVRRAFKNVARQQNGGDGGAHFDDEDHRVFQQPGGIQLDERFLRRPPDNLRIEQRARVRQLFGEQLCLIFH